MANIDLLAKIPTKATLEQNNTTSEFKVTVFNKYKKKPKSENLTLKNRKRDEEDDEVGDDSDEFGDFRPKKPKSKRDDKEMEMRRARHEVLNYGISGFGSKDKKEAELALLIKLGAKPKKPAYRNYKEILEEKKQEKIKANTEEKKVKETAKSVAANLREMRAKKSRKGFSSVLGGYDGINIKTKFKK